MHCQKGEHFGEGRSGGGDFSEGSPELLLMLGSRQVEFKVLSCKTQEVQVVRQEVVRVLLILLVLRPVDDIGKGGS